MKRQGYGGRIRMACRRGLGLLALSACHADPPPLAAAPIAPETSVQAPRSPRVLRTRKLFETQQGPFGDGGSDIDGDGRPDVVVSNRDLHVDRPPERVKA